MNTCSGGQRSVLPAATLGGRAVGKQGTLCQWRIPYQQVTELIRGRIVRMREFGFGNCTPHEEYRHNTVQQTAAPTMIRI
ncbi:hypothetical protein TNCV_474331 [Trichonephila clavipes]|nr:hypothetical protein TNCV_474331 [Trichonephila clavipes]